MNRPCRWRTGSATTRPFCRYTSGHRSPSSRCSRRCYERNDLMGWLSSSFVHSVGDWLVVSYSWKGTKTERRPHRLAVSVMATTSVERLLSCDRLLLIDQPESVIHQVLPYIRFIPDTGSRTSRRCFPYQAIPPMKTPASRQNGGNCPTWHQCTARARKRGHRGARKRTGPPEVCYSGLPS